MRNKGIVVRLFRDIQTVVRVRIAEHTLQVARAVTHLNVIFTRAILVDVCFTELRIPTWLALSILLK